ncbi:hypothetical protein FACS189472_09720 [Alphaproteobacteria bacterium]|nr:hypothetical protein FACS189472_09720 [Alphaproteobacteria bacterium]
MKKMEGKWIERDKYQMLHNAADMMEKTKKMTWEMMKLSRRRRAESEKTDFSFSICTNQ